MNIIFITSRPGFWFGELYDQILLHCLDKFGISLNYSDLACHEVIKPFSCSAQLRLNLSCSLTLKCQCYNLLAGQITGFGVLNIQFKYILAILVFMSN